MFTESIEALDFIQSPFNNSLVFIDSAVVNHQILAAAASPQVEMVMLDSAKDGIAQISEALAQRTNVSSVHVVSHGQPGSLQLGTTQVSLDNLATYDDLLGGWSEALTDTADLLLYGCNVATGDRGQAFIQELSHLTGADVAASTDLTGNSTKGGDWNLEAAAGAIEAGLAFQSGIEDAYSGVLMAEQAQEMMAGMPLLDLVPHSEATHVAVKSGSWSDPTVWKNGEVPDRGANVLIPEDFGVTYDTNSDARLNTLRVDGSLKFASAKNTKMLIDTFVVAPDGQLTIGTKDNPVQADKTAQIIFTSDSPIDKEWDPTLLSRGLVSHGQAKIYGAEKLDFVALQGNALKGDNELVLDLPNGASTPSGWQVGDQLVLGGTSYKPGGSNEDNTRFRDEVLTITAINGNRIRFTNNDISSGSNSVLRFDHKQPEGFEDEGLKLYIANTTRNVVFETENGENAPIQQRGHVMFMHNPDVGVNNAGFYNLGRSDKSKLVDDPVQNVDGSKGSGTNRRGRYSLHFHRTGADDINSTPSMAKGNAVVGSPGWGIVQHDSHAVLEDNVVFNVAGAGIVAEDGNEIGAWRNNITIKTTGDKNTHFGVSDRRELFDFGFEGGGYWVQGAAQVEMTDNVAISSAGAGIDIFSGVGSAVEGQDINSISVANLPANLQYIGQGLDEIPVSAVPLRRLSGFESYNSKQGIATWEHMSNGDGQLGFSPPKDLAHNARALIDNFKLWNIHGEGVHNEYSTQVDFVDGLIVGNLGRPAGSGISSNAPAQNHLYKNLRIEGFKVGMMVPREGRENESVPFLGSRIENSYFANNTNNLSHENSRRISNNSYVFPDYFEIVNTTFSTPDNNTAPNANFSYEAAGGLAVQFDGSASFDSDSPKSQELSSHAIASYGWDFDGDSKIDQFGRELSHVFETAGDYQVTLTVWDNQGEIGTSTQTINVKPSAYSNLIVNGDFSTSGKFSARPSLNSEYANKGWFMNYGRWTHDPNLGDGGAAVISQRDLDKQALGQVILDHGIRRGEQTLSLDLKNTEGSRKPNEIHVQVWGIDGEFKSAQWLIEEGPEQFGALPMTSTKLLDETVGGSTFDWKTFNWDLDFDDGYQFILFRVTGDRIDPPRGDFVAIDNVKIQGGSPSGEIDSDLPNSVEVDTDALNNEMVMRLDFENSGTTAIDSSPQGNNNQGELRNGAAFRNEDGFGNVVDFDGDNDFIEVNDSSDINLGIHPQRTISLWFKTDDKSLTDRKQVLYEEGGMTRGLNIYLDRGKLYAGGWNRPTSESNWAGTFLSTDAIASNTWHHVTLVLDAPEGVKDVQSGAFTAYLDGIKIGSGEGSQLWGHGDNTGLGGLNQGTRFHNGTASGTGTHGLLGSLDDVRLYNRALTAQEVAQLAQSSSTPLNPIRVEAESMNLTSYRLESNSSASKGQLISFVGGATQETGTASFNFAGQSGTYDVVIGYYDENDGVAQLEVKQGDTVLDSWSLNQELGSSLAKAQTLTTRTIAKGLAVNSGDLFTLVGTEKQNEHARIDYIEFIPALAA